MARRRIDRPKEIGHHECSGGCNWWGTAGLRGEQQYYDSIKYRWPWYDPAHAHLVCCHNAGRPKYVCFSCRRAFKPSFIPGNEYAIARFRNAWLVRPDRTRLKDVWDAHLTRAPPPPEQEALYRAADMAASGYHFSGYTTTDLAELWAIAHAQRWPGNTTPAPELGMDALRAACLELGMDALRAVSPELWWTRLESRCPGCGGAGVQVGAAFRVPRRRDERAWRHAERAVSEGRGEKELYRLAPEDEAERWREAARVREKEQSLYERETERRRRLQALGLLKE
ncbi:hypothetical protein BV25DRAFT_1916619 [Artomyces pyxidatus]|uniref:Uncharacterized protein n=1 Tax=Artomyces pyxidatus TaxID=48021 RepID=A0ACB8T0D6_9AGAM|nr:hypothetical protein BV25DRAFT_1916619 [Artomyces pyxidatus]